MLDIKYFYPEFKSKCLTFSYDDGVIQDKELLKRISTSNFKITFNLNSGLFSQLKYRDGVDNSRLSENEVKNLYGDKHEIASHSLYHFHMENLNYEDNYFQIQEDIKNLSKLFDKPIRGFAYPFSTYNEYTLKALKDLDVKYARTTKSTYSFDLPQNFLLWNPTIHHNDKELFNVVNKFLNEKLDMGLLYIWGHSYEFANQNNFDILDKLVSKFKNEKDVAYLTNIEVFDYINAIRNVKINNRILINNSSLDIYFIFDNKKYILKAHEELKI